MGKDNLLWLRKLHGREREWHRARKQKYFDEHIAENGRRESLRLAKTSLSAEEDYPVDFVVTWVDGGDPEWQIEKDRYMPLDSVTVQNNPPARYRDWELFQYWFRGVEKYAPWVRYVYLVTWGHLPKWLNLEHPKLKIVRHEEFIPAEYLPTFNCGTIEFNLWRIDELSEHFVYFNDDIYLTKPVLKNNFFHNGLPMHCSVAKPIYLGAIVTSWVHKRLNSIGQINSLFSFKDCIAKNPEKWFSYKYGNLSEYNLRAYKDGYISGMHHSHLGYPFRRTTMEKVWKACGPIMHSTCMHKFRTDKDVEQSLFHIWEMCNGTFEPIEPDYYGYARSITIGNIDSLEKEILSDRNLLVCANDGEETPDEDFPELKRRMITIMEKKYPEKSSFEK